MSVAVRRAIYGKLSGDTTLTNLLGTAAPGYTKSIYYQQAPEKAGFPYVVFSKQSSTPRYALGARLYDNDLWLIKAVDRRDTADGADAIASRLDALLTDASLSISGKTQLYLRRESDVDYPETSDGVVYHHAGSLFRLITE
jgi:hypothetical protein